MKSRQTWSSSPFLGEFELEEEEDEEEQDEENEELADEE